MRIGQGFDVHRLVTGRPLVIGGVEIPHDRGLEGHSDGDVLLHAVADAILGALGQGDLGVHFPSSDPALRGIASARLLERVVVLMREQGQTLANPRFWEPGSPENSLGWPTPSQAIEYPSPCCRGNFCTGRFDRSDLAPGLTNAESYAQ